MSMLDISKRLDSINHNTHTAKVSEEMKDCCNTGNDHAKTKKLGESTKITKSELRQIIKEALKEELHSQHSLKEWRSSADIQAEIARLQQELADAKVREKKASYGNNLPKFVYAWDMYIDPADKGTWTSLDGDMVFETEDDAENAGIQLLSELDHEGELGDEDEYVEPMDYAIDVIKIPVSNVSNDVLIYSNLKHLIP